MLNIQDFLDYAAPGTIAPKKIAPKKNSTAGRKIGIRSAIVTTPEIPLIIHCIPALSDTPPAHEGTAVYLVEYSPKSFAIFGDTKPHRDRLAELGGAFNARLKNNGIVTPGWIFSNSRKDGVRKAFNL